MTFITANMNPPLPDTVMVQPCRPYTAEVIISFGIGPPFLLPFNGTVMEALKARIGIVIPGHYSRNTEIDV
jgi:hypothetical protein